MQLKSNEEDEKRSTQYIQNYLPTISLKSSSNFRRSSEEEQKRTTGSKRSSKMSKRGTQ